MRLHDEPGAFCHGCAEKLKNCHSYLSFWFHERVKKNHPEAHISDGFRSKVLQDVAFKNGLSNAKWPESPHNHSNPYSKQPQSLAVDVFQIDKNGIARWDPVWCAKLNAAIEKDGDPMKWGGKFKVGPGKHADNNHFEIDISRYFIGPMPNPIS